MNPDRGPDAKSVGTLLGDAVHYLGRLVRGELALAKAEVRESIRTAITGLILVVAAVVIALSALNVLSAALVSALVAQGLAPVWAAVAVAVLLCVIAMIFGWLGVNALKPASLMPRETAENVRRDVKAIKESLDHDPTQ
ncbi:phage holin family protein [Frigidibacter sp. SD6-1]|uniref:phage holin family protein n=1 Tax=Frigidibacter sp. SD6-1 TaxID=3032581 RepID=UPI0024E004AF|nr:phage holin family protein [Frigidibacter sp. SD6-1]